MAKRIFLSPPHMGGEELGFVREAFESNYIAPVGPMVDAFEREFCECAGIPYGVAVSSGTAACHLALRLIGVGPGDVVIASTLTFIGSVTPILFQGATPIFIDADRSSWTMDPALLERAIERLCQDGLRPKAVLPTDLYGQCADYDRIFDIAKRHGIPVVLDSAEALGAQYFTRNGDGADAEGAWVHAGKGARAAFFSFNGNKILTTSGGGMLVSEDRELIEKARFLSQQARDPEPHYEHTDYGYNYRMSNLLAAVGRGQLKILDERVKRKREIFEYYRSALADLPGIEFMPEAEYSRSTRWLTVILISPEEFGADREDVRLALEEENIESRPVWKPMHMQPVFNGLRRKVHGARCTADGKIRGREGQTAKPDVEDRKSAISINSAGLRAYGARRKEMTTDNRPRKTDKGRRTREHARRIKKGAPVLKGSSSFSVKTVWGGAVGEDLFNRGLCLPSGTQMTEEDLDRVVRSIRHQAGKAQGKRARGS